MNNTVADSIVNDESNNDHQNPCIFIGCAIMSARDKFEFTGKRIQKPGRLFYKTPHTCPP